MTMVYQLKAVENSIQDLESLLQFLTYEGCHLIDVQDIATFQQFFVEQMCRHNLKAGWMKMVLSKVRKRLASLQDSLASDENITPENREECVDLFRPLLGRLVDTSFARSFAMIANSSGQADYLHTLQELDGDSENAIHRVRFLIDSVKLFAGNLGQLLTNILPSGTSFSYLVT